MTPERSNNRRDPAGGAPGSKNVEVRSEAEHAEERPVERVLHLDSDENFSQLIFSASLVQLGPARGVFKALAEVIDKKAVRIFRKWLSDRAGRNGMRDVSIHRLPSANRLIRYISISSSCMVR